jgi:hypothetical protein
MKNKTPTRERQGLVKRNGTGRSNRSPKRDTFQSAGVLANAALRALADAFSRREG